MTRKLLLLLVLFSSFAHAQIYKQSAKVIATDRSANGDFFGISVDVDGNYAIVGAHTKCDSIGGQLVCYVGAAYIYERDSTGWHPIQKLTASDQEEGMEFGNSVSISGNIAAVGAHTEDVGQSNSTDLGAVYLFQRDTVSGQWSEVQKVVAGARYHSAEFGHVVDLHRGVLAVSSHQRSLNYNTPTHISYAGSVYLFKQNALGVWQEEQEVLPDSSYGFQRFGHAISLSDSTLVVGVPGEDDTVNGQFVYDVGTAYVFKANQQGVYTQTQRLTPGIYNSTNGGQNFGHAVAVNEQCILIGEPGRQNGGASSVFLPDSTGAYVFSEQLQIPQNWNADVGQAVAVNTEDVFIAAPGHRDPTTNRNTGCVYWYRKDSVGTNFVLQQAVYANDKQDKDNFGNAIAVGPGQLFVGAYTEEHDLNGNNPRYLAGSAYHFDFGCYSDSVPLNRTNFMLHAQPNQPVHYQWVHCDSGYVPIPGANSFNYQVTTNGAYAVIRNWNGCSDTSRCVLISGIGLDEEAVLEVKVYPNPTKEYITLDFGRAYQDFSVGVYNTLGQQLETSFYKSARKLEMYLGNYPDGVYLIEVKGKDFRFTQRLVKEE